MTNYLFSVLYNTQSHRHTQEIRRIEEMKREEEQQKNRKLGLGLRHHSRGLRGGYADW